MPHDRSRQPAGERQLSASPCEGDSLPHGSEHAASSPRGARDAGRCVLYIDDKPASIALMRDVVGELEQLELIVVPAAGLGLELARAQRPRVIILEVDLPDMCGLEAARRLRHFPETRGIPLIGLSAAVARRDPRSGEATYFHRFLSVPVRVDELLGTLAPLLQ